MNSIRLSYGATLAGYLGLFLVLFGWNVWIDPSARFPRSLVLLILVGPMLFPLRGLLQGNPYTFAWSGYLALGYFIYSVGESFAAADARYLAISATLLSTMWFVGSVIYARLKGRELKQQSRAD